VAWINMSRVPRFADAAEQADIRAGMIG